MGLAALKVKQVFSKPITKNIQIKENGILECCYHTSLANELIVAAATEFWDENLRFICAVNYMLCKKVNYKKADISLKVAGLSDGNLTELMGQVKEKYIKDKNSAGGINLSYNQSTYLDCNWGTIKAGQMVRKLLDARKECLKLSASMIKKPLEDKVVSKALAKTLLANKKTTDETVMELVEKAFPEPNFDSVKTRARN